MSIYTGDCNCFDDPAPAGRPPLEDDPLARERIAEGDYRYYHPRAAAPENEKCSACGYTIPHTKHRVVVAAPTGESSEENMDRLLRDMDRDDSPTIEVSKDALRGLVTAAREAERHRKDGDTYRSAMIAAGNEVARLWEALREIVEKAAYDHAAWKLSRIAQDALREERTE